MPEIDPNKNCHEYCKYAKHCRYQKGSNGLNPDDCSMYYKIEDLIWDSTQDKAAERAEREQQFWEVDDW